MISEPYLVPAHEKIRIIPLLTVPEAAPNGYRFAGVPDGIGAFADEDNPGYFDVLITHEFRYNYGGRRAHAHSGAFVSRWRFDKRDWNEGKGHLKVVSGEDLIQTVRYWEHAKDEYSDRISPVPLERLCSADLPARSALCFTDEDGTVFGTKERLFLGGEETHTKYKYEFGRALAHILTGKDEGTTYELPRLGRASWENVLASPHPQRKTVVMLPDDATAETSRCWDLRNPPSELYVYVGEKTHSGLDHERAGLMNGRLYGVQVHIDGETVLEENHELGFGGAHSADKYVGQARFRLVDLGRRSRDGEDPPRDFPGTALQKDSIEKGVTQFFRPEDGCWDPRSNHKGQFWVATTGEFDRGTNEAFLNSRLFHLAFDDIEKPEDGGTIRIAASAYSGGKWRFHLLDSVTVDRHGRVFAQEDPDRSNPLSRTLYFEANGAVRLVATANPRFFDQDCKASPAFITSNEEAAGIVPMDDILGEGWFLTAVQCNDSTSWPDHLRPTGTTDAEWERIKSDLETPGQLLAIHIPPGIEKKLPEVCKIEKFPEVCGLKK